MLESRLFKYGRTHILLLKYCTPHQIEQNKLVPTPCWLCSHQRPLPTGVEFLYEILGTCSNMGDSEPKQIHRFLGLGVVALSRFEQNEEGQERNAWTRQLAHATLYEVNQLWSRDRMYEDGTGCTCSSCVARSEDR